MLSVMTASNIVKNIRPECMNAAETMGSILDALATRNLEIERLQRNLDGRDDFIGARGLWDEFVAQLPAGHQQKAEGK